MVDDTGGKTSTITVVTYCRKDAKEASIAAIYVVYHLQVPKQAGGEARLEGMPGGLGLEKDNGGHT